MVLIAILVWTFVSFVLWLPAVIVMGERRHSVGGLPNWELLAFVVLFTTVLLPGTLVMAVIVYTHKWGWEVGSRR